MAEISTGKTWSGRTYAKLTVNGKTYKGTGSDKGSAIAAAKAQANSGNQN